MHSLAACHCCLTSADPTSSPRTRSRIRRSQLASGAAASPRHVYMVTSSRSSMVSPPGTAIDASKVACRVAEQRGQ